jgi:hypothetical protein
MAIHEFLMKFRTEKTAKFFVFGAFYDNITQLLRVLKRFIFSQKPIVHVFQIIIFKILIQYIYNPNELDQSNRNTNTANNLNKDIITDWELFYDSQPSITYSLHKERYSITYDGSFL